MRIASLIAAAAAAVAAPSLACAAVMVARFEGAVGGIHSTGSTRFGHPPLYVFSGPFVAEITYDTEAGAPVPSPAGWEARNAASIVGAWIEFEDVRLEFPSATYGQVTASPFGFSASVQYFVPNVVLDSLSITASFAGTGDLETPLAPFSTTGEGQVAAASNYATGVFMIDLFGNCSYECGGMSLNVSRFSISPFQGGPGDPTDPTDPGGPTAAVPEPGAWALMILGFGGAGAMLRRRRTLLA